MAKCTTGSFTECQYGLPDFLSDIRAAVDYKCNHANGGQLETVVGYNLNVIVLWSIFLFTTLQWWLNELELAIGVVSRYSFGLNRGRMGKVG